MPDPRSERPAFYALPGGGWRDWWTILHPPYTLWHLSYVALGAASAPRVHLDRLAYTLAAFFLAVGIGAHALDELNGRPLHTRIPSRALVLAAGLSIAAAIAIGGYGVARTGPALVPFIAAGSFVVCAYNLEWFGGRFHTDRWFALAWGSFPAIVGAWAQGGRPGAPAILVAGACYAASSAQRALSTPVRALRRRTRAVEGRIERNDGTTELIDRATLSGPPEAALRALSVAMPLLACAAVIARVAAQS